MDVRKCMTTRPVTASANSPLAEALELMARRGLRHIPVLGAGRKFVGVIHECDVRTALSQDDDAAERDVLSVTRLGELTLHGSESVEEIWELLSRSPWLNPLPVLHKGRLVGTVSQHDLLRALAGLPPKARAVNGNNIKGNGTIRLSAMLSRISASRPTKRVSAAISSGTHPPMPPRAAG
jgi:CBS domain-containing protein